MAVATCAEPASSIAQRPSTMSSDNPHSARLKNHKEGTDWGYAPYDRAMKQIADTEVADKRQEPLVRTLQDLIEFAGLDDEDEDVEIGCTLEEIKATITGVSKEDKSMGRNALLAKLKAAGVGKLSHRQKLTSAALKAKREGKLRPKKPVDPDAPAAADDEKPEKPEKPVPKAHPTQDWDERFAPMAEQIRKRRAEEAAAAAAVEAERLASRLAAGQQVKLLALMSRADLNGKIGKVVEGPNERGRYTVEVTGGEKIALKFENLAVHGDPPAPPPAAAPATVDVS